MNCKTILLSAAALIVPFFLNAQSPREKVLLDEGWKFAFGNAADPVKDFGCGTEYFNYLTKAASIHNEGPYSAKFDDSSWQQVRLPHDWAATLPYAPQASHSHGYKTVGFKYPETSVGWYRKSLTVGPEDEGKRIFLQFDGIFRDARVWFNGFYLGNEPSGYLTQVYDVSEYVHFGGENLICVRADATLEEGWFYEGAGIYRDVWLLKRGEVGVAPFGTFVRASLSAPYDRAVLQVETRVENGALLPRKCLVQHILLDADGHEVGRTQPSALSLEAKQTLALEQRLEVDRPRLWNTEDPYLYKVQTLVSVDGRVVDSYETVTGFREVAFDADKGFLLNGKPLKLKGVNMHQDHAGVGAAIPEALLRWRIARLKELGCNAYRSAHNPASPALLDICDREGILVVDENRLSGINAEHLRQLESMIRRDRNHPSVILWSCGNEEWGMENTVQGTRVAAAMREFVKRLDPTRPSTLANAGGGEMIKGVDVVGYNYIAQNNVENRRKEHPEWKIVGTEETTGAGTRGVYFGEAGDHPGTMPAYNLSDKQFGVENVIERGWRFYNSHPWAAGIFYWTGFDYRGEPNPLSYPAHDSEFGILDYCGFPKDEAWYLKAWWTGEPVLHIFPHWNLAGHEGEPVEIWAYSNCDEVQLSVNGKNLGRQIMPRDGHLKWKAVYKPGKVVAVGYKGGKRVLTRTVETTGAPAKLVLEADRRELLADGRDVAVVTVKVCDAAGRVVPDASPSLSISLEGPGRIIGAGNGNPSYPGADHPDNPQCRAFSFHAFNGLCQVLVQSGSEPAVLELSVGSGGLQAGSLKLELK